MVLVAILNMSFITTFISLVRFVVDSDQLLAGCVSDVFFLCDHFIGTGHARVRIAM